MNLLNNFVFVVLARSGSKRVKNKNIKLLNGKPLILYTLDILKRITKPQNVFISTDSTKILNLSKKYKFNFVKRPKKLSADHSKPEDVIINLIKEKKLNIKYKWCAILQPTSPFRTLKVVKNILKYFLKYRKKFDSLITLTETKDDYWYYKNSFIKRTLKNAPRNQKMRKPQFFENGHFYIFTIQKFLNSKKIYSNKTSGYIISKIESLDINTPEDFYIAKKLKS